MNYYQFIVLLAFFISTAHHNHAQRSIVAKGAELSKVAEEYIFTEGPAADLKGNVYFTDQPNNRIVKWSTDGTLSVFMEGAGRANGLYFDKDGNLIACADEKNELWLIDKNKDVEVLVDSYEGKKLNGPNDVWVHPDGGIYFTDPFYKRDYWNRSEKEVESEDVYYLSPDYQTLTVAATDLVRPNGIIGTSDGETLFVADINDKKTYRYQIGSDGKLSNRELFVEMGSDGMTLDTKGNLYLTGKAGVTVFNSEGKQIEQIPVPENWTANVCFGGKNRKTLFITAMKSVYTMKMGVKGAQ
jgi:gluconolactonase